MNIEKLKAGGIDYEEGLDRFSGNVLLYEKYLRRLLDLTLYQETKAALERDDIDGAFESMHKLKAFIGNLSIPQLYEEIQDMTEKLRSREKRDYTKNISRMDEEYERVLQAIKSSEEF